MRYDQIIAYCNEITSKELFTNFRYIEHLEFVRNHPQVKYESFEEEKAIRYFTQRIEGINITNELLRQLEEEYADKTTTN